MKILTVIGARPQFIKAATVSRALAAREDAQEIIVHTGQHFDENMSDVFFTELEIPRPDHNLGVQGGSHGAMTGQMLIAIESVILAERPDRLLIYGDTNSTLAAALAASKLGIPIAHVEAGLRSFNRRMPEEINRIVADRVSTWLLTPTDTATENLRREGIAVNRIHQVGDVMYDAALFYSQKAQDSSRVLAQLGIESTDYVLATVHRQENTDVPQRLRAIINALTNVANTVPVVLPLHPRTRRLLDQDSGWTSGTSLIVIPPVGYLDMVMLEKHAAVIATDSGGVQKEAFFHKIPCVTLRDETEWVELTTLEWNRLAPPGRADIASIILDSASRKGRSADPYGSGNAAKLIASIVTEHLS
jgi:UDP-GlcNAc3NAcA epimerase